MVELRFATKSDFVGRPIDAYRQDHAVLSASAAVALAKVHAAVRPFGLGLKVFDTYRPRQAVDRFVRWGKALEDRGTKAGYRPEVSKADLFKEGYVASRSGHSRGGAVDLTIVYHRYFRRAAGVAERIRCHCREAAGPETARRLKPTCTTRRAGSG